MMKMSPRTQLILVAAGIVVVVAVLAAVLVIPQFGRLSSTEQQIAQKEAEIDQAQALLEARQAAKENAAGTDAALLELAAGVPENPDLPSFIIELQDVAYSSNVQLRSVAPADMVDMGGYAALPIELQVWGEWADVVDFMQRLNEMQRQVRLVESAVNVMGPGDTADAVDDLPPYAINDLIQLNTYIIPAASAGAGQAVPAPPAGQ